MSTVQVVGSLHMKEIKIEQTLCARKYIVHSTQQLIKSNNSGLERWLSD